MKTFLDEICALYDESPWGPVPTADDWQNAQLLIGRALPEDFKQIMNQTGGCPIGHGLCLLNPAVKENDFIALNRAGLMRIYSGWRDLASLRDFELFPDIGGYIPIGTMDLLLLLLRPDGDEIYIADFGDFDPPKNSGCGLSAFLWKCWTDRQAFDALGSHFWRNERESFFQRGHDSSQK